MFLEEFHEGNLPKSISGALIILLPKPGKSSNRCEDMRPKSSEKTTRIITRRNPQGSKQIYLGYVKDLITLEGYLMLFIVWTRLLIRPSCHWMPKKAFKWVELPHHLNVLNRFGCGNSFQKSLLLIYPTAEILTKIYQRQLQSKKRMSIGMPIMPVIIYFSNWAFWNRSVFPCGNIQNNGRTNRTKILVVCWWRNFISHLSRATPALLLYYISGYAINNIKSSILLLHEMERVNCIWEANLKW